MLFLILLRKKIIGGTDYFETRTNSIKAYSIIFEITRMKKS